MTYDIAAQLAYALAGLVIILAVGVVGLSSFIVGCFIAGAIATTRALKNTNPKGNLS